MRHTFGGLDSLLRALREQGLAVGALELTRLRTAFAAEPHLSPPQLAALLRCTLVKHDQQRETFDRVFDSWVADADGELRASEPPLLEDTPFVPPPKPPVRPAAAWAWILVALTLVVDGAWVWCRGPTKSPTKGPVVVGSGPSTTGERSPAAAPPHLPSDPVAKYTRWYVDFDSARDITYPSEGRRRWWLLLLLAAATAAAIWRLHLRALTTGTARPLQTGPTEEPLLPPPLPDRSLLSAAQARMVVASVDSFVAEEPAADLDLPRTVDATAVAAGIPDLAWARARGPREVWLWLDRTTQQPTASLLVGDLTRALQRGGHSVRVSTFHGDLAEVTGEQGERISPLALEAHRQQALVAVFTDGDRLLRRSDSAQDGPAQAQVLTALSRWPHVALVDCGTARALGHLAAQHDLRCLTLDQAPAFVGLQRRAAPAPRAAKRPLHFELGDWAQTLALWPGFFLEADALDVHTRLGLDVPRYDVEALLAHATPLGIGYEFPAAARAELLQRLARSTDADTRARACGYWIERCTHEDAQRTRTQTAMQPWTDAEAQARLQMERAFVRLWIDPDQAAKELDFQSRRLRTDAPESTPPPLAATIRERLAQYTSAGSARSLVHPAIPLPWRWQDLARDTQLRLWRLGFGKLRLAAPIRPSAPTMLGLGLCLGVAVAAAVAACLPTPRVATREPPRFDPPAPLLPGLIQQIETDDSHLAVFGEPSELRSERVPPGAVIRLRWEETQANNEPTLWRRGTFAGLPTREPDWPWLSRALIRADPTDLAARQLAIALLDSGTADSVEFTTAKSLDEAVFESPANGRSQWLVFRPGPTTAADRLSGPDRREAWAAIAEPDLTKAAWALTTEGKPSETWAGQCETSAVEPRLRVLYHMVWIRGGTFLMGSADNDPQASGDEQPQHEVRVAPFLLWRTELTRGEYRTVMPAAEVPKEWTEPEDDRLPANYVDFYAAVRCCNALSAKEELTPYYAIDGTSMRALGGPGYRLPSEAEWEHACRAGTTTLYWAGDQEADLARVGWYRANSEDRVHPVAAKPANAHGLHDMHGNVWEWCEDTWQGPYKGAPTDGRAWVDSASQGRLVRGGSFDDSASVERSAVRVGALLGGRIANVGFRPARSAVGH